MPLIYGARYVYAAPAFADPLARAAAVLPELRADAPGDRVGRPARLSRHRRRSRSPATSPPTSRWCRRRASSAPRSRRCSPRSSSPSGVLCVLRCGRIFVMEPSVETVVTNLREEPHVMMPTREQELAVLRSVIYASLFDYPLTLAQLHASLIGVRADAETIAAWWREQRVSCRPRSSIATVSTFLPAAAIWCARRRGARRSSRELLDRDRRILSLVAAHAVRPDGGALGQPRPPQRRRIGRSRSVRDHRAASRVERDGRRCW